MRRKLNIQAKDSNEYARKYRELTGIKSVGAMHKKRFGGLRDEVLERDGYKCKMCGMTSQEHKDKWERELTVNHIDKNGRYSKKVNNTLENLETLCLRCHGHKDAIQHGKYSKLQV